MIRIGPAGWSYPDWEGIVYPSEKPRGFDPLEYLSRYFDTVEINSTFYRPQRPDVARRWARRVKTNDRFKFTAKLWRRFTHERDSAWSRDEADAVRDGFSPLAEEERLGAVLVQFPWSFKANDRSLEWLDDILREFSEYPLVVEVRHASWNKPEFYDWLGERGVGFVNIDQPLFGRSLEPSSRATAPVGYVRLHGRNYEEWFRADAGRDARYDYLYQREELEPWVERIRELARSGSVEDVYVVTNNHYRGQAVANAVMMAAMLRGAPQKVPQVLYGAFPDVLDGLVEVERGVQERLL